MQFIPWQFISDWRCQACGRCCKAYNVVVSFPEWLNIVKNFGIERTFSTLNRLFLKKEVDGSCTFLYRFLNTNFCSIQHSKPKACKLWPFKILKDPRYGYANQAFYQYGRDRLYVYADSNCYGLAYGVPGENFKKGTLKEFIEIALGNRRNQHETTGKFRIPPTIR
ncbi:MAG: YkgJ family cysteine cluster protein [Candidatus Bathyarchaeota archaeon]|jgi:Fe-S-cluster containining protein